MYLNLFLLPFFAWLGLAIIAHFIATKRGKQGFLGCKQYVGGMFVSFIFIVVFSTIILVSNLMAYSDQRANFNNLQNLSEKRLIFEKKMINMTAQYKEVLVNDYTSYEKGIFGDMSPEDATKLQTLLSVYPQLKASVTISAYAENIKALNDDIYQTDIDIRETVKSIRWNYITPWIITSWMPEVPTHLTKYVNN